MWEGDSFTSGQTAVLCSVYIVLFITNGLAVFIFALHNSIRYIWLKPDKKSWMIIGFYALSLCESFIHAIYFAILIANPRACPFVFEKDS